MKIEEPNDLLRLCYEYKVQQIPISRDGSIKGTIRKESLVSHLSQSEHFDLAVTELIPRLLEPVEENLIDSLREKLKDGSISGIPIVAEEGTLEKTITPGLLKAEEESEEFLEQSEQLDLYETLLEEFPFPLRIDRDQSVVFENNHYQAYDVDDSEWIEETISLSEFSIHLYLPSVVSDVFDGFTELHDGESIELRSLLESTENNFLRKAHRQADSISAAAELVNLPRQTFNYRWKNQVDPKSDN